MYVYVFCSLLKRMEFTRTARVETRNTQHCGRGKNVWSCQKHWSLITALYSLRWLPFFLGGGRISFVTSLK